MRPRHRGSRRMTLPDVVYDLAMAECRRWRGVDANAWTFHGLRARDVVIDRGIADLVNFRAFGIDLPLRPGDLADGSRLRPQRLRSVVHREGPGDVRHVRVPWYRDDQSTRRTDSVGQS